MKNPVPWIVAEVPYGDKTSHILVDDNGIGITLDFFSMKRIAQCVNACADMENPRAEIERLKQCKISTIESFAGAHPAAELYSLSEVSGEPSQRFCGDFTAHTREKITPVKPSWHELGELPPVGTECEYMYCPVSENYQSCKIVAVHGYSAAFVLDGFDNTIYVSTLKVAKFRPIKTQKQKTIEEMLECFNGFFDDDRLDSAGDVCEKIYNRFLAKDEK